MKLTKLFTIGYILNWILFLGCIISFLYFKYSSGLLYTISILIILIFYSYFYLKWRAITKNEIEAFYIENENFFKQHNIDAKKIKTEDFLLKMQKIADINSRYSNEDKLAAKKIINLIREMKPELL